MVPTGYYGKFLKIKMTSKNSGNDHGFGHYLSLCMFYLVDIDIYIYIYIFEIHKYPSNTHWRIEINITCQHCLNLINWMWLITQGLFALYRKGSNKTTRDASTFVFNHWELWVSVDLDSSINHTQHPLQEKVIFPHTKSRGLWHMCEKLW